MRHARTVSIVAATVALAIGIYLSWLRARGETVPCLAGSNGCATVAASSYAKLAGIPVSVLGALGSLTMLVLAFATAPVLRAVAATIAFVGCAFSLYLTWVELSVLDAVCQWCVASAICWVVLAVNEALRLRAAAYSPT